MSEQQKMKLLKYCLVAMIGWTFLMMSYLLVRKTVVFFESIFMQYDSLIQIVIAAILFVLLVFFVLIVNKINVVQLKTKEKICLNVGFEQFENNFVDMIEKNEYKREYIYEEERGVCKSYINVSTKTATAFCLLNSNNLSLEMIRNCEEGVMSAFSEDVRFKKLATAWVMCSKHDNGLMKKMIYNHQKEVQAQYESAASNTFYTQFLQKLMLIIHFGSAETLELKGNEESVHIVFFTEYPVLYKKFKAFLRDL